MTHFLSFKPRPVQKLKRFQEFVFMSDSAIDWEVESIEQLQLDPNSSSLGQVEVGNVIQVEQICAPQNIIRQLREWNFQTHRQVRLVSKSNTGSVVVESDNKLIGIGARIARRIIVIAGEKK